MMANLCHSTYKYNYQEKQEFGFCFSGLQDKHLLNECLVLFSSSCALLGGVLGMECVWTLVCGIRCMQRLKAACLGLSPLVEDLHVPTPVRMVWELSTRVGATCS